MNSCIYIENKKAESKTKLKTNFFYFFFCYQQKKTQKLKKKPIHV